MPALVIAKTPKDQALLVAAAPSTRLVPGSFVRNATGAPSHPAPLPQKITTCRSAGQRGLLGKHGALAGGAVHRSDDLVGVTGSSDGRNGETTSVRRCRILDAALAIVRSDGLAALSLSALARTVGMEPQSLYTYFASKLLGRACRHGQEANGQHQSDQGNQILACSLHGTNFRSG